MSNQLHDVKIYHVDWSTRELSHIEFVKNERAPMPEQGRIFDALYGSGDVILIVFATDYERNRIPDSMKALEVGTLRWSRNFAIEDFGFDESGVYGSLSFNSKPSFVYISWDSVQEMHGINSGVSYAWNSKK